MKSLRKQINDEHHKLLKHVETMFLDKKKDVTEPRFPMEGWLRVKSMAMRVTESHAGTSGAVKDASTDASTEWMLETKNDKDEWRKRMTFRNELKSAIDEVGLSLSFVFFCFLLFSFVFFCLLSLFRVCMPLTLNILDHIYIFFFFNFHYFVDIRNKKGCREINQIKTVSIKKLPTLFR